jgi:ATP-binding cassette, subfamily B, bacterial MsbA
LLIELIKEHKVLTALAVGLGLLVALLETVLAVLMMPLILFLSDAEVQVESSAGQGLTTLLQIFRDISPDQRLLSVIVLIMALAIGKNISLFFSNIFNNDLMLKMGLSIRHKCIELFMSQRLTFFNRSDLGELLSCVNEQVQRAELMASYLLLMINNVFIIALLFVLLIVISPSLTVYVVLSVAGLWFVLRVLFKAVSSSGNRAALFIGKFTAALSEILSGMRVVKTFNAEEKESSRTHRILQGRYKAELRAWRLQSAVGPFTETVGIMLVLGIMSAGLMIHSEQDAMAMPLVVTYIFALLRMWPRLNHMSGVRAQFNQMKGSMLAIESLLSRTDEVEPINGERPFPGLEGAIEFRDVSYQFPGSETPVLNGFSLKLHKGETTALVGSSGGGKSTIADLLLRFDDPSSGTISIDGVDLKEIDRASWREQIGVVSQDTFLFNISVSENIAYGMAHSEESEIIAAAKAANAYEFIQAMPEGFETVVGDRGTMLSGGQRQRIAIARAIIRNPLVLILDEATSALDTKSEQAVQQAIENVGKERTVLVIAHRISTVENADNIVVISEGQVLEQGRDQELREKKGAYYSLITAAVKS